MNKLNVNIKTLGERVKLILSKKGISVHELAVAIKVSQSTISRIINGETKSPNSNTINSIAKYLQVNTQWLKTGNDEILRIKALDSMNEPIFKYENSNDRIIQNLIKSLINISESVKLNAIANERNSRSMEKMIDMITKFKK